MAILCCRVIGGLILKLPLALAVAVAVVQVNLRADGLAVRGKLGLELEVRRGCRRRRLRLWRRVRPPLPLPRAVMVVGGL